jgi:hypothetical protein
MVLLTSYATVQGKLYLSLFTFILGALWLLLLLLLLLLQLLLPPLLLQLPPPPPPPPLLLLLLLISPPLIILLLLLLLPPIFICTSSEAHLFQIFSILTTCFTPCTLPTSTFFVCKDTLPLLQTCYM